MSSATTIVFGPTGHVGSVAAITAAQLGAKVVLALRDTQKPIPGLTADQENSGSYERIQADLNKPETIEAAVRTTGAKSAFLYLAYGTPDHMRGTIEALKASGIEFVVFLSSFAVDGDLRSIEPSNIVAYLHGQVEINLEEVLGADGYVAVRPAFFNTNVKWWAGMIREGEVKIAHPNSAFDWISPEDIGRVAGTLLVQGFQETSGAKERNFITLCGPKLVSQGDAMGIFGKAIGKDVKVTEVNEEEGVKILIENGVPEFVAEPLVKSVAAAKSGSNQYAGGRYTEGSLNLKKYAGQVTSLDEWAVANKEVLGV
ncbi:NmrA-like family protein [Penicillium brasilianum]|uniref:NmrA-like family protein n=1 Tax=Penicillium brasilianum TaxID=104259 RepID=A0A1S9S1C3_PENBI|nr:NmrA-like family protein [Penicillium brasilianum]